MIKDAYVQYQSAKAAEDMFREMKLLLNQVEMKNVHYIDDETAATDLELYLMMKEKWEHLC